MVTLHRYGVASFLFRAAASGAIGDLPWNREFRHEIFVDNEHSMRNYWRRASLGLLDLEFDFINSISWIFEEHTQTDGQGRFGRNRTVDAARRFFAENDIVVQGYDHLVIVVPPMPIDWGATPVDIALEQIDIGLPAMQRYSGTQDHQVTAPAHLVNRPQSGAAFWRSERRPSRGPLAPLGRVQAQSRTRDVRREPAADVGADLRAVLGWRPARDRAGCRAAARASGAVRHRRVPACGRRRPRREAGDRRPHGRRQPGRCRT